MNNQTNHYGINPDEPTVPDLFIRALIKDAMSPEPALRWEYIPGKNENERDMFVVNGFSGADAKIVLTVLDANEEHDSFKLVYYRKGEQILSAEEYALFTEHSDLRQLHAIVSHGKDAPPDEIEKHEEILEFIADTDERLLLDRILGRDFPTTTPMLVGDIFRAANAKAVVDGYLEKVLKCPRDTLSNEHDYQRFRTLAMATITVLRYMKRAPTGATFTKQDVPETIRQQRAMSRTIGRGASLFQIANAWTTWHDIYPPETMCRKEMVNRTAILLLAAILKEN